jgi:hypothetical protein
MRARRIPLLAILLAAPPLAAQIRPSERASVAQTVDGTRLTVEYSRPRVRGRDSLFGKLERWDQAWTPGADSATTLRVSKAVRILGHAIPAARYSVWLVPRKEGAWTFVLDPRDTLYHSAHPDSTPDQIRVPVTPQTVPQTEALTWWFPSVSASGTTLQMRWGTVAVEVPVEVTPTFPLTVAAADAAPYLGDYDFTYVGRSTRPSVMTIVRRDDGTLLSRRQPDPSRPAEEIQLLPAGADRFVRGFMVRGELWMVDDGARVVFQRAGGGAITGFEVRRDTTLEARGTRRP